MDNKILSGIKTEQELSNVTLEDPDVDSSPKETLTEDRVFDKIDSNIPVCVKIEQLEDLECPEINSSSQSCPSITNQEHSQIGMFDAIDNKLVKQEISDTLCKDQSHRFTNMLGIINSNNFQQITENSNMELGTNESACKVSSKLENCNHLDENVSNVVEIIGNSSLNNETLQFHQKKTGVGQAQIIGRSRDFTMDLSASNLQKTQASNKSDGCDPSVSANMNICGVETSVKPESSGVLTEVGFQKPYKCDICDALFNTSGNLICHARKHTGEKPYKCEICGISFANASNFKRHMRAHMGEKPYKCDICGACFVQANSLNCHKRTHTGEKPYKCDTCAAFFVQVSGLNRHKRTHTAEKLCGVETSVKPESSGVLTEVGFRKPYKCDICDALFNTSGNLNCHRRKHTGEKPYKCGICRVSFANASNFKRHMRAHIGEKPYKCDICGACFVQANSLNRHKRTHTGEKPYKCDTCGACFVQVSSLNRHKRTHTGEKPYKCDICGACYVQGSSLDRHKRTHTGDKPYACDVCGACFIDRGSLNSHKRTHTGKKPYICDICCDCFTDACQLKYHKRKHTE